MFFILNILQNLNITKIIKNIEINKKLINFYFRFSIFNLFCKKKVKFLNFINKQINKKNLNNENLIKISYLIEITKN